MGEYNYRLFYQQPPIDAGKTPDKLEFKNINFDAAYQFAKGWVKKNTKAGTMILMLAQLNR